jgi:hypothetical protein
MKAISSGRVITWSYIRIPTISCYDPEAPKIKGAKLTVPRQDGVNAQQSGDI